MIQPGGVRDRIKATQAVFELFARRPKGVKAFVATYCRAKLAEARQALRMPDHEAVDEVLDHAAANGHGRGREPGEDG